MYCVLRFHSYACIVLFSAVRLQLHIDTWATQTKNFLLEQAGLVNACTTFAKVTR